MFKFLFRNLPMIFQIGSQIIGFALGSESNDDKKTLNHIEGKIDNLSDDLKALKTKVVRQDMEISNLKIWLITISLALAFTLIIAIIALVVTVS